MSAVMPTDHDQKAAPRWRPILFLAPMVRAILAGRKTQTRRVVKPQPRGVPFFDGQWLDGGHGEAGDSVMRCPYGRPGDRLWVRETWQYFGFSDDGEPCVAYLSDRGRKWPSVPMEYADSVLTAWRDLSHPVNFEINDRACDNRWRSPTHMPRWASRITLEVESVRVERLQAISEEDCYAEGVTAAAIVGGDDEDHAQHAVAEYRDLWESIHGPGSWDANPWVWAVSFRRITP